MSEKIGKYTEDEILEHLTEGEGRSFLGRSMYDAIFDKIHTLKTKNEQLKQENKQLKEEKQNVINYIVKELVEINKHQYAKGSRRLKKILELLGDSNE